MTKCAQPASFVVSWRGHRFGRAEQEPRPLRPQQVALSERPDRRRMETGRTGDPARQDLPWQADGDHAGGGERPHVHSVDRLSVAGDPERPAAKKARSTTTSICGPMTAPWNGSTTRFMSSVASKR